MSFYRPSKQFAAWRYRTEMWYNCGMRTIAENANDFVDLRTADGGNCIYVDKTDYFHRLVTAGSKRLFFIARPRRFGKSLGF